MTDPGKWPDSREFWKNKRVCVTGGAGFLGSFVVDKLRQHGAKGYNGFAAPLRL